MRTLVDLLSVRAEHLGDAVAFRFLGDGESETARFTFSGLCSAARRMAAGISRRAAPGTRVVLLYPSGLEFVQAFFGVLHAGSIPVAMPPLNAVSAVSADNDLLVRAVANCDAGMCIVDDSLIDASQRVRLQPGLRALDWATHGELCDEDERLWRAPLPDPDALAVLQYTSGSTAAPKGVRITHRNVLANLEALAQTFGARERRHNIGVSWLPMYHDMGLIGGILLPVFASSEVVVLSPGHFAARPLRWLQAIHRYRANFSGGPNMAYELCVRGVGEHAKSELDLSCWQAATNGSEPLRASTLLRFARSFASCGFSMSAFRPCYGLAEASLLVSASRHGPVFISARDRIRIHDLTEANAEDAIVSSGTAGAGVALRVVDPHTGEELADGEIGEVQVAGDSVSPGYWDAPQATGKWLSTGDIGFVLLEELFVTSRRKDMIIVGGRNIFPHDVEECVQLADSRLKVGAGAVFGVKEGNAEALTLVQEVSDFEPATAEAMCSVLRGAVFTRFRVPLHRIVFVRAGSVPRTHNGKLRRIACRTLFLDGTLKILHESITSAAGRGQHVPAPRGVQA